MRATSRISRPSVSAPRVVRRSPAAPGPAATPIVKWAGGKSRLLPELVRRLPPRFTRYHEPFAGGAALFFHLAPSGATLSDLNAELIGLYRSVRDDVEAVIAGLEAHAAAHDEARFYTIREEYNAHSEPAGSPARAATFIYLNKTCFNGLWRVNSRGAFNVPVGRYARPSILSPDNLRAASLLLERTGLEHESFEAVLDRARRGDLVYFDPPYVPASSTSDFTSYTADGFGPAHQERLAEVFSTLAARGCHVMLSNSDTPLVRKLYAGHRIDRVMCSRAINSRADARGAVGEVIVTPR